MCIFWFVRRVPEANGVSVFGFVYGGGEEDVERIDGSRMDAAVEEERFECSAIPLRWQGI